MQPSTTDIAPAQFNHFGNIHGADAATSRAEPSSIENDENLQGK